MVFGMLKIGERYTVENFFDFLGESRDRKSVIEIAQNYRKKRFLRITDEPVITGKKRKIFTTTNSDFEFQNKILIFLICSSKSFHSVTYLIFLGFKVRISHFL